MRTKTKSKIPLMTLLFSILLSMFYGVIFSSQILGFFGLYKSPWSTILSVVIGCAAFILYLKTGSKEYFDVYTIDSNRSNWLEIVFFISGSVFFLFLIFLPIVFWPYTPIKNVLNWDVGLYHFTKAVELFKSGSMWDLSIPYGQYPLGYESLFAQGLSLTGNEILFGLIHALTILFLLVALWMVMKRYTRLPGGLLWFCAVTLLFSGKFVQAGNPWHNLIIHIFTVGKNDLFINTAILGAIASSSITRKGLPLATHNLGLAMLSMIILSVKPNGILVVIGIWAISTILTWVNKGVFPYGKREIFLYGLIIFPGLLWVFRNIFVMNRLFSTGLSKLMKWSIANNLGNPYFYKYLPKTFIFVVIVGVFLIGLSLWKKKISWSFSALYMVLFVSFILSPTSGFFGGLDYPTSIRWRFGLALLLLSFICLMMLLEPLWDFIFSIISRERWRLGLISLVIIIFTLISINVFKAFFSIETKRAIILKDQFSEPVGVNGYYSAYDYIQKNIRNSVIQIENGMLYYIYGPGYTNTPIKSGYPLGNSDLVLQSEPDYFLVIRDNWWSKKEDSGSTDLISNLSNSEDWIYLYQDPKAVLFQRNK